jgi:hypothetical protein
MPSMPKAISSTGQRRKTFSQTLSVKTPILLSRKIIPRIIKITGKKMLLRVVRLSSLIIHISLKKR